MTLSYIFLCGIAVIAAVGSVSLFLGIRDIREPAFAVGIGIVIASVVIGIGAAGRESKMTFTEVLNGQTLSKSRDVVSCEHSYECNCYDMCTTNSDGSSSCTRICSICFYHSYDVDWNVKTSIGRVRINRRDWQGLKEPLRWTVTVPGEPVAMSHRYKDYIRSSDTSILTYHRTEDPDAAELPAYPIAIFDYYRLDRLVTFGVKLGDTSEWNRGISDMLRELGPKKQVNVVVVITDQPAGFVDRLLSKWNGANKNDAVVFLGVGKSMEISWARVFSLAKSEIFNVQLERNLKELGSLDRVRVLATIESNINENFERRSMKEFSYLREDIPFPTWVIILAIILGTVTSVGWLLVITGQFERYRY